VELLWLAELESAMCGVRQWV